MAKVLRTRRSHVSITLSSLRTRGYVEDRLGRVKNEFRRRRVYFLTHKGYVKAIQLRGRYLKTYIGLFQNGEFRTIKIEELNGQLGDDFSLAEILSCIKDNGVLDLESLRNESDSSDFEDPVNEHELRSIRNDSGAVAALHILL